MDGAVRAGAGGYGTGTETPGEIPLLGPPSTRVITAPVVPGSVHHSRKLSQQPQRTCDPATVLGTLWRGQRPIPQPTSHTPSAPGGGDGGPTTPDCSSDPRESKAAAFRGAALAAARLRLSWRWEEQYLREKDLLYLQNVLGLSVWFK